MKITLTFGQFLDNLPESRKDQFSYFGWKAIFEWLENYEEDTGEEIEFDPIAICCEWTEYKNFDELKKDYSGIRNIEQLRETTTVLELEDFDGYAGEGLVIMQF